MIVVKLPLVRRILILSLSLSPLFLFSSLSSLFLVTWIHFNCCRLRRGHSQRKRQLNGEYLKDTWDELEEKKRLKKRERERRCKWICFFTLFLFKFRIQTTAFFMMNPLLQSIFPQFTIDQWSRREREMKKSARERTHSRRIWAICVSVSN